MIETYASEPEWIEARRKGCGASECARIVRGELLALWLEKRTGTTAPVTPRMEELRRWGHRHEPAMADEYAFLTGRTVTKDPPFTIRRREGSPLFCTLDRHVEDAERGAGVLELKTADAWIADDWEDAAPVKYQIQLQAQLAVTGATWGVVCGLIGGNRLVPYEYSRDDAFIEQLLIAVAEFWKLVESGTAPAPDASLSTREALGRMYPRQKAGKRAEMPPEAEAWFRLRQDAKAAQKAAQAQIDEAEAWIKATMGDAEIAEIPGAGEITWKAQEQKPYTVAGGTRRVLRVRGE